MVFTGNTEQIYFCASEFFTVMLVSNDVLLAIAASLSLLYLG